MDPLLLQLDRLLRDNNAVEKLSPVFARLLHELEEAPTQPQAWQPLDSNNFNAKFPGDIVSAWLFVLRGGGKFPNERHPNSWQRSIALHGRALFEVYDDCRWQQRPLNGAAEAFGGRAISIPPNMWHRIEIGPEPFVSLSFHTTLANELIEETCVGNDFSRTQRRCIMADPSHFAWGDICEGLRIHHWIGLCPDHPGPYFARNAGRFVSPEGTVVHPYNDGCVGALRVGIPSTPALA